MKPKEFILKHISKMHGYVPGLQPEGLGIIKLNTNENPFPPSKKILKKHEKCFVFKSLTVVS